MRYITPLFRRTNIDPAPIKRKDSESSENISSGENNVSENEEDIVLTGNALSTDTSLSDDNDGYDEKNGHTTGNVFYCNPFRYNGNNVRTSRSGTTATTYEQVDYLYLYTVWHVSFVYYIYAYFSMTWYLIRTKLQHNTSLICNYMFFLFH